MEDSRTVSYASDLKKVLKNYQTVAMSSLGGPSSNSARWAAAAEATLSAKLVGQDTQIKICEEPLKSQGKLVPGAKILVNYDYSFHPPPFPIQQMPVFTPLDRSKSEKTSTILEGEAISCFTVGGEKRLCLPQILNSVLRDFDLQQINITCDELHIYCSRCNPEQLEILKLTGILPFSAPSCGLITNTDAERLCNALLRGCSELPPMGIKHDPEKPSYPTNNSFKVYHECFGKCRGLFTPELYENSESQCIACLECDHLFSPQKFVIHSHWGKENRTCHWGFDSGYWRNYLLLCKDQVPEEKWGALLEEMKLKFDFSHHHKRKQNFDENDNPKRSKAADMDISKETLYSTGWPGYPMQRPSAFRPWSPSILMKEGKLLPEHGTVLVRDSHGIPTYLSMGPPVLVNPERVVPNTAASKFDSQLVPNVALVPSEKRDKPSLTEKQEKAANGAGDEHIQSDMSSVESSLEREIELVKALLESDALDTKAGRDRLLQELARIRVHQEERLQNALQTKKSLLQEVDMMRVSERHRLVEATEAKRNMQRDVECIRMEYQHKLRELDEDRQRMDHELRRKQKSNRMYELSQENAQIKAENKYLRKKLVELEGELKAASHSERSSPASDKGSQLERLTPVKVESPQLSSCSSHYHSPVSVK